jgi:hypothetical protein
VLAVIDALRESTVEVQPPFIVVAERQQSAVRAREQRRCGSTLAGVRLQRRADRDVTVTSPCRFREIY